MIVLRNEQLDVFRASARKKLGESIRRGLVAQGLNVEQRASDLVLRDSRNHETRLTFAADGLPESIVRPSGLAYHFEFDKAGRLAALVYPSGRRMEFDCDDQGNVQCLRQPGFAEYRLGYVQLGKNQAQLESLTYPDGRTRQVGYDTAGRIVAVTEPSGANYTYERNEQGHIAAIIDPLGQEVWLDADELGALQVIAFPDGSDEAFQFDEVSQTAVRVHRDGSETRYKLDEQDRCQQLSSGNDPATNFGYDMAGNLAFAEQGGRRVSFAQAGDHVAQELTAEGTVFSENDGDGRLTCLRNPFGDLLKYSHDADGRLCRITLWDARVIEMAWNDEDQISEIQFPGGVSVRQVYGATLRLSQRQVASANRLLQDTSYSFDDCSRFTGYTEATPQANNCQVVYDQDDHLVAETLNGRSQHYRYDAKGNQVGVGGSEIIFGSMDEPLQFDEQSITYDALGNMLQLPGAAGMLECWYRHDGLLAECRVGSELVTFQYDALGRRVEKRSRGHIWRYGWAGFQLLWEESRLHENATPVRRDYLFTPGSVIPLGFREKGRCYWLISDVRGAVDMAVDDQGQVVWKAVYNSFGLSHLEVNAVRQPWRLPGQYADDETGLYYNFARYYSPHLRSYLSLDPRWIEFEASHYSYCRNDPWNRADPFGGLGPLALGGLFAVAGGIIGGVIGGVVAVATGGDFASGVASGAVSGAVAGVGVVVSMVAGTTIAAQAAVGAVVGGISSAIAGTDPVAGVVQGAVAGAVAAVTMVAGASAVVIAVGCATSAAVGAFAGSITEQVRKGDGICVRCAVQNAGVAALISIPMLIGGQSLMKLLPKNVAESLANCSKGVKGSSPKAPTKAIPKQVARDLKLVDKIIGSKQPSPRDIAKLYSKGGMNRLAKLQQSGQITDAQAKALNAQLAKLMNEHIDEAMIQTIKDFEKATGIKVKSAMLGDSGSSARSGGNPKLKTDFDRTHVTGFDPDSVAAQGRSNAELQEAFGKLLTKNVGTKLKNAGFKGGVKDVDYKTYNGIGTGAGQSDAYPTGITGARQVVGAGKDYKITRAPDGEIATIESHKTSGQAVVDQDVLNSMKRGNPFPVKEPAKFTPDEFKAYSAQQLKSAIEHGDVKTLAKAMFRESNLSDRMKRMANNPHGAEQMKEAGFKNAAGELATPPVVDEKLADLANQLNKNPSQAAEILKNSTNAKGIPYTEESLADAFQREIKRLHNAIPDLPPPKP